jgi:hypothetical protein
MPSDSIKAGEMTLERGFSFPLSFFEVSFAVILVTSWLHADTVQIGLAVTLEMSLLEFVGSNLFAGVCRI